MEHFNSLLDLSIKVPTAITIGKFDGIHRGHHLLTSDLISKKSEGLSACIITFKNSPRFTLTKDETPYLFTNKEKEYILEKKGINYLISCPFDKKFMQIEAIKFIEILCKNLNMKYLVVGTDFTFGYKKSGEIKNFDTEIDLYMDIKKIVMRNEFLGYYFYFTKLYNKNKVNINYVLEKNEMNDSSNSNLIQIKKYQCQFKSKDYLEANTPKNISINNHNQMFNSLVIKPNKNDINYNKVIRKKERKKSQGKSSKVVFKDKENNFENKYSLITNSNNNIQDFNKNQDVVDGNYVPKFESYFCLDIKNQSFVKKNANDESNYLETLRKEANNKKKIYDDQLKLLSKEEETEESEENESDDESSEDSESKLESSISHSHENKKESDEKETQQDSSSKILKKKTKKVEINESSKDGNSIFGNSTKKLINKSSLSNNYFKVNLSNVHLMVYDFYKDMIVEGNKNDIVSKVDHVMSSAKNQVPTYFDKDGGLSFMSLFHPKLKNKKSDKDSSNQVSDINNSFKTNNDQNKKIINEEKLFEKKISNALKKQKDEPPIKKLKIFASFFYIIMVAYGILSIFVDKLYLDKINKNIDIVKKTISVKYCSYISVYYLRELSLINFDIKDVIEGAEYSEYMANSKDEISSYIEEELMNLFIENQSSLKNIYSTSVVLSNASATLLKDTKLKIRMSSNFTISNVILVSLMQYNGAFNNLATSTSDIRQNHPDLAFFLYNSLNGYKLGINYLISFYSLEFETYLSIIIIIVICVP